MDAELSGGGAPANLQLASGVVDFRARPNTQEYLHSMLGEDYAPIWKRFGYGPPPVVELSEFLDELKRAGVDLAVFTGRMPNVSNDYVAETVAKYPDVLIGMAGLDPAIGPSKATAELRRCVEELDLRGVSMDAHFLKVAFDDRLFYPIYAAASDLNIPVNLTLGPYTGPYGHPDRIATVAEAFPELTIVCSHGCWPQVTEFIRLAWRFQNVILEASIYEFLPGAEPFIDAANSLITDQVVYASAFPFNALDTLERFKALPLSEASLQKILWDNPRRVLGLS